MESTAVRTHASHFRPDVEGLRAIAVGMVLLYHIGVGWASGGFAGVDVFFVISGFLITGQLAKEVERTGSISLLDFYSRRAKRLFPAAALVLATTALLAAWLLPSTRWTEVGGDIFASAAYFINWQLAARSVDYLAEDSVASPVQHFWSLAVEEQYYIVWPALLVITLLAFRRVGKSKALWATIAGVALPSLCYSIYLTQTEPGPAYFSTLTRMWELAIGAAVALGAAAWARIPARIAQIVGWTGVAAIVAALLLINTNTPWPSYSAALPTLGAAAVIVGGYAAGNRGPVALLGTRGFCWVGAISYSLYLWHWPMIEFAKVRTGVDMLTPIVAAGVVALSMLLAWITLKFVENPIRFSTNMNANPRYALSTGANFSLIGAVAGLALVAYTSIDGAGTSVAGGEARVALGAKALRMDAPRGDPAGRPTDHVDWYTPAAAQAVRDIPQAYEDDCQLSVEETTPKTCIYGKPDGKTTVAVVGDSKIVQWMPALELLAHQHEWKILLHGKSSCGFHSRPLTLNGKPYTQCTEWNRAVLDRLLTQDKPDFLITSHGRGSRQANEKEVAALLEWWTPLAAQGTKIIAIANNPNPRGNVYECVAENPEQLTTCAFPRNTGSGTASLEAASRALPGASFINMNDAICPDKLCAPIIGNVLIYRQGSHVTRTYIESMAPRLDSELRTAGLD